MKIDDLKIAVYADGADINEMMEMHKKTYIKGFTTNPTLMRKAGVTNYKEFVQAAVQAIPDMPISFEVFSDDFECMEKEAIALSGFGENVFVKIPITNTKGMSCASLISGLSKRGVNLNITAVFTTEQAKEALEALEGETKNIISVFAGRIADAGVDPEDIMRQVAGMCRKKAGTACLWASCREIFNIMQAERCGVDIITVTGDLLTKMDCIGKSLKDFSLETVRMFARDGESLGFSILNGENMGKGKD